MNSINKSIQSGLLMLVSTWAFGQSLLFQIPEQDLWPRPNIIPIPDWISRVEKPVILLNGEWKITGNPQANYWENDVDLSSWKNITVPGQIEKLGFYVQRDKEYAYKTEIKIPENFQDQRIFVRFEGVTGTAKAWINGHFLKEHYGGFNVWTCEITDYVSPGDNAWLTVGIIDETVEKSTSSFNYGGIIRHVKLMAVPNDHIRRFHIETDLDENYRNATMKVWLEIAFNASKNAQIKLILKAPSGELVPVHPSEYVLDKDHAEVILGIPVKEPIKWNAEHPNLYTLSAVLESGGNPIEIMSKKIGFREIEIDGVHMMINGKVVKLRGAGRFDSDPEYGRYLSDEKCWEEVKLLKEANLNFVRPSCYPATEAYLKACDSLGLYVQIENSVTFTRGAQRDTLYTPNFMNQMAEMIEEVRSHPSVIIYELANETGYGVNIGKTYQYTRVEDPTRPVIYSWSQSVSEGDEWPYEIFSYHYPDWDADLGTPGVAVFNSPPVRPLPGGMPVLHDEFAHGSSYYQPSLARDPGMRNFWGESIKVFWERMFETEGCLGGAQWAIIDENAYGSWAYEWGAIDLWRRKRPEYWHMKKAYSPIRIQEKELSNPGAGNPLIIPVKNWYDHTNFNELKIRWKVGEENGVMEGPEIEPHDEGKIVFKARDWKNDENLELAFIDSYDQVIDEFKLPISPSMPTFLKPKMHAPRVKQNQNQIIIRGKNFELEFSKTSGLIEKGIFNEETLIHGGPFLHITGAIDPIDQWRLSDISAKKENEEAIINISGTMLPIKVNFEMRITGDGLITTRYTLDEFIIRAPKPKKIPWDDQDAGGFQEIGISYILTNQIEQLSWKRDGLWTVYPENHIGRNEGIALRTIKGDTKIFSQKPTRDWSQDERDFSVFGQYDMGGRGTNDFRSMKEYIYYASAISQSQHQVRLESDGTDAIRLEVLEDFENWVDNNDDRINFSGSWRSFKDSLDFFSESEIHSDSEGDYIEYSFDGSGICWIGRKGPNLGNADVYIDGKLEVKNLNLASRGTVTKTILFSRENLPDGSHIIKIVAKNPLSSVRREDNESAIIPLDAFKILREGKRGNVKMIINNQWNYTKMGLGNYMKQPIVITSGYSDSVKIRLGMTEENKL